MGTPEKRDWTAFERKLSDGKPIAQSAQEAGIELEEAVTYCEGTLAPRRQLEPLGLAAAAQDAVKDALQCLRTAMNATGGSIDAAAIVLKFTIDAQKLALQARMQWKDAKPGGQLDLFDRGDWVLKTPGV